MNPGLTFDAESHTYRFNGQLVPGVTTILKAITDFSAVPITNGTHAAIRARGTK